MRLKKKHEKRREPQMIVSQWTKRDKDTIQENKGIKHTE